MHGGVDYTPASTLLDVTGSDAVLLFSPRQNITCVEEWHYLRNSFSSMKGANNSVEHLDIYSQHENYKLYRHVYFFPFRPLNTFSISAWCLYCSN